MSQGDEVSKSGPVGPSAGRPAPRVPAAFPFGRLRFHGSCRDTADATADPTATPRARERRAEARNPAILLVYS